MAFAAEARRGTLPAACGDLACALPHRAGLRARRRSVPSGVTLEPLRGCITLIAWSTEKSHHISSGHLDLHKSSLIVIAVALLLQREKRDYYLNMQHMRNFTEPDLAIANAWLDPEVKPACCHRFALSPLLFMIRNSVTTRAASV